MSVAEADLNIALRITQGEDAQAILYWSQPKQSVFHTAVALTQEVVGKDKEGRPVYRVSNALLYGGAAGGGKTEALVWEIYRWGTCEEYTGLKIGVFRKTFPELDKYFISRCLESFPVGSYRYLATKHKLIFLETGTAVEFNSCEHEFDVLQYQGAQYDILIIDELTHFSEFQYKYLRTRNRPSKGGIQCGFRPIFLAGTNPGGLGHQFVKRLFVRRDEYKMGEGTKDDYLYIPAKVWDNPALLGADPYYVQKLEALPEQERRALLEGDWDIFAGQYFGELRYDVHAFDPSSMSEGDEPMPKSWGRFIAFDYGFFPHPASVGWYAVDGEGRIYRYKELLLQRNTFEDLAGQIVKNCTEFEKEAIGKDYIISPPDIWAKRGNVGGKSGAEEMQDAFDKLGVKWLMVKADNDRINGWRIMHQYLRPYLFGKNITARLLVSGACTMWWKSVPELQHDPRRPDDVFKLGVREDTQIWQGDDCGDETRYAVMSRYNVPKDDKGKEQKTDRYGRKLPRRKRSEIYKGITPGKPGYQRPQWKGLDRGDVV